MSFSPGDQFQNADGQRTYVSTALRLRNVATTRCQVVTAEIADAHLM